MRPKTEALPDSLIMTAWPITKVAEVGTVMTLAAGEAGSKL